MPAASFLAPVSLLALNVWIVWPLFTLDIGDHFASIDGAFIAIARYLSRHWNDHQWWPISHGGMPFQDVYVPLLHLTTAAYAKWGHVSAGQAYHAVTGLAYCFGPVALYALALRLGACRGAAYLAGLCYSIFSPCVLVMPLMRADVGGWFYARRLQVLIDYGEGPHITAMTLAPVALLALERSLQLRTSRAFALAALALAVVFLTNVPGTMGLGVAVFCWLSVQPGALRRRAWWIAASAAALGYAVACYGIPPLSLLTVVGNVGPMHSGFRASLHGGPLLLAVVLGATAGVGWLLTRPQLRLPLYVRFGLLYAALLYLMVTTVRRDVFELLPQVGRLHVEFEMGASLVIAAILWGIYSVIPRWVRPMIVALCLMPLWLQINNYLWWTSTFIRPIDLSKRSEYATARWLDAHARDGLVYTVGSTGFWLNAFTDTPQIVGCCEQGQAMAALNTVPGIIDDGISPSDTDLSLHFLQALGVQTMVVSGPKSTDEYKDVIKPERWASRLTLRENALENYIYAVPQRSASRAHVIRREEVISPALVPPYNLPEVSRYVGAIEDPTRAEASFRWIHNGEAQIDGNVGGGELLSLQVPWTRGWRAQWNGADVAIASDGLGMMLLTPPSAGEAHVHLVWTGTPDLPFAAAVSIYALTFVAALLVRRECVRMEHPVPPAVPA